MPRAKEVAQARAPRHPEWVEDVLADLPALVTVGEAANALRCSTRTIARYIASGRLRAAKAGEGSARVLIPRRAVGDFLSEVGS